MTEDESGNVFINCPFDQQYSPLLKALLFAVVACGFEPRIASERSDSGENRLDKIFELIELSRYSIHDLSRIKSEKEGEYFRLNMPFEIGVDWAARKYKYTKKRFLILESEQYSTKRVLSDLSGCDVEVHTNEPRKLVIAVRNWLSQFQKNGKRQGSSKIWDSYNEFYAELYKKENFSKEDIDQLPIPELIKYIKNWISPKARKDQLI